MSGNSRSLCLLAFVVGFFFSFRTVLAMISARWLHLGSEPGVIAGAVFEFALLLAIVFDAIGPVTRPKGGLRCHTTFRWVLIFLGFSCSSLIWSATVSRSASFLYWCLLAADVAMVVLLLRFRRAGESAHAVMRGFILSSCVLASIAWIIPVSYDLRLGDPEYFNTNQIGNMCALSVLTAQFLSARSCGRWKLAIFFLTVTLIRSLSKATLFAFFAAESFLLLYDKSIPRRKKGTIVVAAVLALAIFFPLIESYVDLYTTTGNQAETLTGRTAIWAYTLEASLDRPWLGNGIDAMWKVFPPFGWEMFEARHAENELLQQFFAYGAVGIVMLAGIYGSLYQRILALRNEPGRGVLIALMLFIVVRGLAEAEPFDLLLPLWMITLVSGMLEQARESNEPRAAQIPSGFAALAAPGGDML